MKFYLSIVINGILSLVFVRAQDQLLQNGQQEVLDHISGMGKSIQEMTDMLYSFSELGFQEFETLEYLTSILEQEGFHVEKGIAGIPTAWMATWGEGKPVISLGSDLDCIPGASQKPGIPYHDPLVEGAPGHGEGHNSGQAVNIAAAIAVKQFIQKHRLSGTLKLWGVPEEQLAGKAFLVRDGYFKDTDIVLFSHVDSKFEVSWGATDHSGMVSVEYTFHGESAHGAAPWRGRSALDAVELMNVGWNYRREHLRLQQRSHYVITHGGDQPNVVPDRASVWYYFRERDYEQVQKLWNIGNQIAEGAALMTNTSYTSRLLGAAWPNHYNKVLAELMYGHIKKVDMPAWDSDDQFFAKSIQNELKVIASGLHDTVTSLKGPVDERYHTGGPSDDIGDVSWVVPTVTLRYPANIPGLPFHHWASGAAMATPIAHKGVMAGAKVQALTVLDLLLKPEIITSAWRYFNEIQTKSEQYKPFIGPDDKPPIWLNKNIMDQYRPLLRQYYYDPTKYNTYLEQLGIQYPFIKKQ